MLSLAARSLDHVTISQVQATVLCCVGVADYLGEDEASEGCVYREMV